MFYYNLVAIQNDQQVLTGIQEISRINDSLLNSVLDEIQEASAIIPNFVLSVTPLTNSINTVTVAPDEETAVTTTERMVLSYRIFSLWQDMIVSSKFLHADPVAYVSNFLQRANSKQLAEMWLLSKLNFLPATQSFGDLLFKYALPITQQVPQSYIQAATQLIADPQYKNIFC